MTRLDALVATAGAVLIVSAAAAIDWRLGALVLGVALFASAIEIPRRRA